LGYRALFSNTTGSRNLALGELAGGALTTGNDNIYLQANAETGNESNTMRLGSALDRTFVDGVRGVTTGLDDAIAVVVDSNGQLGTVSSSRRTKTQIEDLGTVSRAIFDLRPVSFTYKQRFADGKAPVQYGLIAEEVEEVLPALVAYGADGQPQTVKYHVLPTLILAEVQRLDQERANQAREIAVLHALVETLQRQLAALEHR